MRFVLLSLIAVGACAQPTPKPGAEPDGRRQRADSVIERRTDAGLREPARGDTLAVTTRVLPLGDGTVTVRVSERSSPGGVLDALNLHDDEGTSVDAALAVVRQRGGRVVELAHSGARTVTFEVDGVSFIADPNRMFTDAGRRRTLASLSRDTPAARAALATFADAVLAVYTDRQSGTEARPAVVTLHNNTPDGYSARSYEPGGEYASDAQAVTVHPGTDPDDFFFVTDRALYDEIVRRGFNAVLQDNASATDDGSLSVWAAREGVPYVNVEAQHGHLTEQTRMIAALADVLAAQN